MSSSRPAPKPATAPKTEPRSSAIDSSMTSTTLAEPNGGYSPRDRNLDEQRDEQDDSAP